MRVPTVSQEALFDPSDLLVSTSVSLTQQLIPCTTIAAPAYTLFGFYLPSYALSILSNHYLPSTNRLADNVTVTTRLQESRARAALEPLLPSSDCPAFHYVKRMPSELKDMVWGYTLPGQTVHLLLPSSGPYKSWLRIKSATLPVALFINGESRHHARRYCKCFPLSTRLVDSLPDCPYRYFDPRTDVLHLPLWPSVYRVGRLQFENLSIELEVKASPQQYQTWLRDLNFVFMYKSSVRTTFFVVPEEVSGSKRHQHCEKWFPIGLPLLDRPAEKSNLSDLFKYPDAKQLLSRVVPSLPSILRETRPDHPKFATMPLSCSCPGVYARMCAKVDDAVRGHAQRKEKTEIRASRKKKRDEEMEAAAFRRLLERNRRTDMTRARMKPAAKPKLEKSRHRSEEAKQREMALQRTQRHRRALPRQYKSR